MYKRQGVLYLDVRLTNNGIGPAQQVQLDSLGVQGLLGTGQLSFNAMSPRLPIALPDLAPGAAATVRLYVNVPSTMRRFSLMEGGTLVDGSGRTLRFSSSHMILP